MRCLTLARELADRGAQAFLFTRSLPPDLESHARRSGEIVVCRLPVPEVPLPDDPGPALPHRHWLGVSQSQDAADSIAAIRALGLRPDWVIVDHYSLDKRWHALLRPNANHILAIDDVADRDHDCDVLLDQNLFEFPERRYAARAPRACKLLLGPHYALLRPEFRRARAAVRPREGLPRRVLVLFGSFDPHGYTLAGLEAVTSATQGMIEVDAILGADNPDRKAIRDYCARHPNCRMHEHARNLAELMAAADLAVGAAGASTWERCCVGLPALAVAIADNQEPIAQACCRAGVLQYVGRGADVRNGTLAEAVRALASDTVRLAEMSLKALALVDGLGAARVCDILEELA